MLYFVLSYLWIMNYDKWSRVTKFLAGIFI